MQPETGKLADAMALLQRTAEHFDDFAPDADWWRDYFLLTGEHMMLVDGNWEPATDAAKRTYLEEYDEWEPDDEVNAHVSPVAEPAPASPQVEAQGERCP